MSASKSATAKNVASVTLIQAGNLFLPLILLPILTQRLGVAGYGEVAFVNAVVAYFVLFTDWGFNLSATRSIAVCREEQRQCSQVFWSTVCARAVLCVVGYAFLELGCWLSSISPVLYRSAFFLVAAAVFSPLFYYQGIERLGLFSVWATLIKISAIPCVWWLVVNPDDIAWALGIPAFFGFLSSLICFVKLLQSGNVPWHGLRSADVWLVIKDGWPLFLSTASISLYTNSNTVILGLIAGDQAVGYFASAMLILKVVQGVYQPVSQIFFSKMSHAFANKKGSGVKMFKSLLRWQGGGMLVAAFVLFVFGPGGTVFVLGSTFTETGELVRWLAPLVFLIGVSNVFGLQGMVPLGYTSAFSRILLASGAINLVLLTAFASIWGVEGAVLALLTTEFAVTFAMGAFLYLREPDLLGFAKTMR